MLFFPSHKKIQPSWSFTADGVIWRLLASPDGYLVGEDRNKETKTVSFFCIHLESGEPLWQGLKFEELWWVGLETIHQDVLFLHEYATPDLPEHKKIYAVDLMTGRVLWENENFRYLFSAGTNVYTAKEKFESRDFKEHDLHTGIEQRPVDAAFVNDVRRSLDEPEQPVQFPSVVDVENPENRPIMEIVEKLAAKGRKVSQIECLEINGFYALSFYEDVSLNAEDVLLDQHFMVVEPATARVVFRELLHKGVKMAIPDAFFAKSNLVLYIKERKILQAVRIPQSGEQS